MTDINSAFPDIQANSDNPEPRCPVVLLLDVSGSMQGERIRALNRAVDQFNHHLRRDPLACLRIEIAIVAVGGKARVLDCRGRGGAADPTGDAFAPVTDFIPPTPLQASGSTPLGAGMRRALNLVRKRKDELRAEGVLLFRPWIVLISDGAPNDDGWEQEAAAAVDEQRRKGVVVYPIGAKEADMTVLSRFSVRRPLRLRGLEFPALFQWLSTSLGTVTRAQPDDEIQLQDPHDAWAEDWTRVQA